MTTTPVRSAFPLELVAPADASHPRRGEASLVSLIDGRILLVYGRFSTRSEADSSPSPKAPSPMERDNDLGVVCAVTLDQQGRPMTPERIVVPAPAGGLNAMNPAVRRLPDGRIGLLYSHRISRRASSRRFLSSRDEGVTWSEPVVVYDAGYVSGGHDRFNVLSTGRVLAPVHCTDDWDSHYLHTRVARSDDGGRTWQISGSVELPRVLWPDRPGMESGCIEAGIAERTDGTLLMTLRTAMGTQFCTNSADAGETWSAPQSLEVVSPSAPAHLSRIPGSDDLLLVWNPGYDSRAPMNGSRHTLLACVSPDGGRSWPPDRRKVLVHDLTRHTDYPAVFYRGDEAWIVSRQSDHATVIQGRLSTVLQRVPLAWLRR